MRTLGIALSRISAAAQVITLSFAQRARTGSRVYVGLRRSLPASLNPKLNHPQNCSVTALALLDLLFGHVLFQQFPVWIDLEAPLFPIRSDDHLIVPLAIRVVFPFNQNDLSPVASLLIVCWTEAGSDFTSTISPGCPLSCAAALKARPTLMAAVSTALVVFTFILSLLCRQTVAAKICLAKHYNFVMIAQAEPRWSPRFAEVEMPQSVVERAAATLLPDPQTRCIARRFCELLFRLKLH